MTRRILNLVVCLALVVCAAGPATPAATGVKVADLSAAHLRRIHLVRPDLIPYPIAYSIVC
jgi:hypothetical protein